MAPSLISVTEKALQQISLLIAQRDKPTAGIRIGIKSRGCSGLTYNMEFSDKVPEGDEVIEMDGINLFIEPKATLFLLGTQMDYVESDLEMGFVFKNPNEKGRCGCGESFHV